MLDLKNCPFCGGDKVSVQHGTTSTRGQYLMVWCVSCQAAGGEHLAEAEAIAAWNRRALQAVGPEPAARDLIDGLLDLRDQIMRGKRCNTDTGSAVMPVIEASKLHILDDAAEQIEQMASARSALVATPPAEPVVEVRDEPCNCPTFEHCDGSCAPYLGTRAEETSVSDAMVKAAITAAWPDGECIYDESFETIEDQMRAALTAALATKPAVKDDETVVERSYSLKWTDAPRPPVNPRPIKKQASFPTFDDAVAFMAGRAPDSEFRSLTEYATVYEKFDRTADARAALAAKDGRHGR